MRSASSQGRRMCAGHRERVFDIETARQGGHRG